MRLYYLSVIIFVIALCTSVCASGANAVGAIPGQFNVSATGAATYEIPIECPAGPNGLKPELKFVYSSQMGDGLMGCGWTISGLSSVVRVPKTLYYDGKVAGVEYTKDDALSVDGIHLIKISETGTEAEFRMENDIYTRIVGYEPQEQGFKYFKAYTKDGRTLTFGSAESDGSCYGWPLTEIVDANGNYITFHDITSYGGDINTGAGRVIYGKNKSGAGVESVIEFEYESSPNAVTQYVGGKAIDRWARVKNVRVLGGGFTPTSEYNLTYKDGGMRTDRSRLASISYSRGGVKSGSTNFTWTESRYGISSMVNPTASSEDYWRDLKLLSCGDYNGDGVSEWLSYSGDDKIKIGHGTDIWNYITKNFNNVTSINFYDIDKDGVDELIVGGWSVDEHKISHKVAKWNPDTERLEWGSISLPWNTTIKVDDAYASRNRNFVDDLIMDLVGDFYGDGTLQFIPTATPYRNPVYIQLGWRSRDYAYREVIKEARGRYPDVSSLPKEYSVLYVTDMNGNGKSDIVCVGMSGAVHIYEEMNGAFKELMPAGFSMSNTDMLSLCDINGDGITDILIVRNSDGKCSLEGYISTGKELKPLERSIGVETGSDAMITVLDVNRDGLSDVYVCDNSKAALYISTGKSFIKVAEDANPVIDKEALSQDRDLHKYTSLALGSETNGKELRFIEPLNGVVELSPECEPDRIVKIEDGMHNLTSIDYKKSRLTGYEVLSVSSRNTSGNVSTNSYHYQDVLYEKEQQRFKGYGSVIIRDEEKGGTKLNRYTLKNSEVQLSGTLEMAGGVRVKSSTYSYEDRALGSSKLHTTLLTKQRECDLLTGLERSVEYHGYDDNGNPEKVVAKQGGQTVTQEITYIKLGVSMFKPSKITTTYNYDGNTMTRERSMKYDERGNLTQESSDGILKIYGDYDVFGNCQTVRNGTGKSARTESVTYTTSGRHVASRTNSLGERTVYHWDETKDQLQFEIDANGLRTWYYYDEFGRPAYTMMPGGVTKSVSRSQAEEGNPYGAAYIITENESDKGEVTTYYTSDGKEVCRKQKGLGGRDVYVVREYNTDGTLMRVSKPSYESQPGEWAEQYEYDIYGRPVKVVRADGETKISYSGLSTTMETPSDKVVKTLTAEGWTESVTTNGKTVRYTYYPTGEVKTATPDGGEPVYMEYDKRGNRTLISEADGGTVKKKYNEFGELIESSHKQGNGVTVTTSYTYSPEGLLQQMSRGGSVTNYEYDSRNRLIQKTMAGGVSQSYEYDKYDRIVKTIDRIDGREFVRETSYDSEGRVQRETYPSGYYTENVYDENGILATVKDKDGNEIYHPLEATASGRITKESRGGKVTTNTFDGADRLTSKVCENIINYTYAYDAKGNLAQFSDLLSNQSCNYTYDELNRLAEWNAYGVDTANPVVTDKITYDESNNMVRKSSLGDMIFAYEDANHPHAVSSISGVPSSFPKDEQSITYTNFNKVESVNQGDKRYDITYGVGEQRIKSEYANAQGKTIRYYIGNYEEVTDPDGTVTKFCYLPGGAMMVEKNGEQKLYYNYTDRLGSIVAIADAEGNVIERYAYDPWGNRLDPKNLSKKDTRTSLFNNRGYTGHEHIDGLDLINMNGRMYDPLIGSFLSVDPFIQAPENWLNYNRYLYGFGNPMKYIDPSGNIGILAAIGIGAAVGAALGAGAGLWYGYNQGYTGQDLEKCAVFGLYIGAGVGALSGYFLQSVPSLIAAKTCLSWTMAGATIGESVGLVGGMAYGLANKAKGWDLAGCALTGSGIGLVAGAIIGAGCYGLYSWFVASSNAARASASASVMGTTIQCEAHSNVLQVQKKLTTLTGFENSPAYRNLTIDLEKSMEVAGVKNVQEAIEFVNYAQRFNRPIIASAEIAAASACRRVATISAIVGTVGASGILAGAGYGYYQLTNLWLKD